MNKQRVSAFSISLNEPEVFQAHDGYLQKAFSSGDIARRRISSSFEPIYLFESAHSVVISLHDVKGPAQVKTASSIASLLYHDTQAPSK